MIYRPGSECARIFNGVAAATAECIINPETRKCCLRLAANLRMTLTVRILVGLTGRTRVPLFVILISECLWYYKLSFRWRRGSERTDRRQKTTNRAVLLEVSFRNSESFVGAEKFGARQESSGFEESDADKRPKLTNQGVLWMYWLRHIIWYRTSHLQSVS